MNKTAFFEEVQSMLCQDLKCRGSSHLNNDLPVRRVNDFA